MNTPKIACLNLTIIETGSLTNISAHDETGQLRGDLTTSDPQAIQDFIDGCYTKAVTVNVTGHQEPEEFFTVWTPDGLQFAFGAGSDSAVQANLF